MNTVPSGIDNILEVTYTPGLNVGMTIYDETTADEPALIGTFPMTERVNGTYVGRYQGVAGHSYSVQKAVYQDSELTELDENYSPGSETFYISTTVDLTSTLVILEALAQGFVGAGATELERVESDRVAFEVVVDEEVFNG